MHLNITFWPFDQLKGHKSSARGAVIVTLFRWLPWPGLALRAGFEGVSRPVHQVGGWMSTGWRLGQARDTHLHQGSRSSPGAYIRCTTSNCDPHTSPCRCNNLVPMDRPVNQSDPMVVFKLNKESKKSSVVWKNLNPRWIGEHFDWFHVRLAWGSWCMPWRRLGGSMLLALSSVHVADLAA